MINGPGVDSARPSPAAIWPGASHPNETAAAFRYARTAYAPPNVTSAALEKKTASWLSTSGAHEAFVMRISGTSQTTRQITSARAARPTLGCACAGNGSSAVSPADPAVDPST